MTEKTDPQSAELLSFPESRVVRSEPKEDPIFDRIVGVLEMRAEGWSEKGRFCAGYVLMDALYQAAYGDGSCMRVLDVVRRLVRSKDEWEAIQKGAGARAKEPVDMEHHKKRFFMYPDVYQVALTRADGLDQDPIKGTGFDLAVALVKEHSQQVRGDGND